MKKPYILITNDDGIQAPGIMHLYKALRNHADIIIAAPIIEKSGSGLATTLTKPLEIHSVDWENNTPAYKITGTPADCVKLATAVLLDKKPDLIVSGINKGSNAGRTVLYSGTVGAVIEGVYKNIPGIAFSCSDLKDPDFSKTENYIFPIIEYILKNPLDEGSFLNVNFPSDKKFDTFKGIKLATQGTSLCKENPAKRMHPEGHYYYWMGCEWQYEKENETSDIHYLEQGYVAAVPIKVIQLSCNQQILKHKENFEKIIPRNAY